MKSKINPEFLPLVEWWEKDGKYYVAGLLIAAVAFGGWHFWKSHRAAVKNAAAESVASAFTTEDLEDAVAKYGKTASGGALRIRLAKSYFDAGRYEEALATYEELAANPPDGFADIPTVGRAQCLEALSRFPDAQKAYEDFSEANPSNYLTLTAQLGAARCIAQSGDKKKALARIDAIKAANKNDEIAKARIESVEDVIKRFGQKAAEKPVAKPDAPAAKPKAKPAPAVKPGAKPAPAAKPKAKPAAPAVKPVAAPAAAKPDKK